VWALGKKGETKVCGKDKCVAKGDQIIPKSVKKRNGKSIKHKIQQSKRIPTVREAVRDERGSGERIEENYCEGIQWEKRNAVFGLSCPTNTIHWSVFGSFFWKLVNLFSVIF